MMLYDAISTRGLEGNYVLQQGRVQHDAIYPVAEPQSVALLSWQLEPRAVEELTDGFGEGT